METQILYNGYFSVDFIVNNTTYNTAATWGLAPTAKPVIKPPTAGMGGTVEPASNSWTFYLTDRTRETETVYRAILTAINGKNGTAKIYYSANSATAYAEYTGHFTVTDFTAGEDYTTITIGAELITSAEKSADDAAILAKYACSFTIGSTTKNTFSNWKLKATAVPVPEPAAVRTTYVEVPGLDGDVDLSEVLGNTIHYGNCEGSWNFEIYDKKELSSAVTYFNALIVFLHGKRGTVVTPSGTYTGRFSVSGINIGADSAGISINYHIDP